MHEHMKSKRREDKPMDRIRITTTLSESLWRALQHEAIEKGTDCNAILEKLIAAHLKRQKKGGDR